MALALARQIQRGDNISHLTDADLFKRLFEQRNAAGENCYGPRRCARLSSFDGENMESSQSELAVLANIAELSVNQVHGFVRELHRRDLVQRRSRWRAILPHAVANRLWETLESLRIPTESLSAAFSCSGREQLLQSFSRRLSYLHNCEPAIRIARRWLLGEHALRDVESLNKLGQAVPQGMWRRWHQRRLSEVIRTAAFFAGCSEVLGNGRSIASHTDELLRMMGFEAKYFDRAALWFWLNCHGWKPGAVATTRCAIVFRNCFKFSFRVQAVQSQRMRFLLKPNSVRRFKIQVGLAGAWCDDQSATHKFVP